MDAFLPDHRWLDDGTLLALPEQGPFTPLTLFVCTYVAKLSNLHVGFVELTRIMCGRLRGGILAVNSNFGHAAQPGYEHFLKRPRPPAAEPAVPARTRARKVQGDGPCFNSAVEPVVFIDHPGLPDDKEAYFIKCFPTTGEMQVPGVVLPTLEDGHRVLVDFVSYLNWLEVGDRDEAGRPRPVAIISERPNMINSKFRLVCNSPRILVNLHALAEYLGLLEAVKAVEGRPITDPRASHFDEWPALVLPPFPVRETKAPIDDVKVSFRFESGRGAPRLNVFQSGKINILGADSDGTGRRIYDFFDALFRANWRRLVTLRPRRDFERNAPARPRRVEEPAPLPAPPPLTDDEIDEVLGWGTAARVRAARRAAPRESDGAESDAESGAESDAGSGGAESEPAENRGEGAGPTEAVVRELLADMDDWGADEEWAAEEWGPG